MGTPPRSPHTRPRPLTEWRLAAADLIAEIMTTAERLTASRTWGDERAIRTDGVWRVLVAIERSSYCLSLADLARVLGVRRQVAHEWAHAAAVAAHIELVPNPDDRRILQARLTPRGCGELRSVRAAEAQWRSALLNGLGDREMVTATHVLRVMRQRLERDAREQARQKRQERPRSREPWP